MIIDPIDAEIDAKLDDELTRKIIVATQTFDHFAYQRSLAEDRCAGQLRRLQQLKEKQALHRGHQPTQYGWTS